MATTKNIQAAEVIAQLKANPDVGIDLAVSYTLKPDVKSELNYEAILTIANYRSAETREERSRLVQKLIGMIETMEVETARGEDVRKASILQDRVKYFSKIVVPHDVVFTCSELSFGYSIKSFNIKNIHVTLRLGEITGVVGQNANGKTTLCRVIVGELAQDTGELQYPYLDPKEAWDWQQIKSQIAYLSQDNRRLPWFESVRKTLQIEAACCGISVEEQDIAVDHIIQRLGLAGYENHRWGQLSGGYKLRLRLALLLLNKPKLLVLDEPLANLDIKAQITLLNDLRDLSRNFYNPVSIVITSQHVHEIEMVADQVIFLRDGEIIGTKRQDDLDTSIAENCFEFQSHLSFKELKELMIDLPHNRFVSNGLYYYVTTPASTTARDFLAYLSTRGIDISYFRDITQSFIKDILYNE
jgi:ABC-2 type transport system ATP-binding protein